MKIKISIAVLLLAISPASGVFAQISNKSAASTNSSKDSEATAEKQTRQQQTSEVSREQRQQAYAKLLEGQRYVWIVNRLRSQPTAAAAA